LNYRHCLRILGHWDVPNRSFRIADSRPVDDHFTHLFIDCLKDPDGSPELISSIQQLKATMPGCPGLGAKWVGGKLFSMSRLSVVNLEEDSHGRLMAVKSVSDPLAIEWVKRDVEILKN
jgi:hypothetical protein